MLDLDRDIQSRFQISLTNGFQLPQEQQEGMEADLETWWQHSKKLWQDTCEEIQGEEEDKTQGLSLQGNTPEIERKEGEERET